MSLCTMAIALPLYILLIDKKQHSQVFFIFIRKWRNNRCRMCVVCARHTIDRLYTDTDTDCTKCVVSNVCIFIVQCSITKSKQESQHARTKRTNTTKKREKKLKSCNTRQLFYDLWQRKINIWPIKAAACMQLPTFYYYFVF